MDFATARKHMIDGQIRVASVTDARLIAAMAETPRELDAPRALRNLAYADCEIETAPGRWLWRPRDLAKLYQALAIAPRDLVLSVGPGSGYPARIAAALAETVIILEDDEKLAADIEQSLQNAGVTNVAAVSGALDKGLPKQGPFDVIILHGAVEAVPHALLDQLAEHGRLGAVVRNGPDGEARIYERSGGAVAFRAVFDAAPPMLPGFERPRAFAL